MHVWVRRWKCAIGIWTIYKGRPHTFNDFYTPPFLYPQNSELKRCTSPHLIDPTLPHYVDALYG